MRASGGQNCEFSGGRLSAGRGFQEYLTEGGVNPLIDDPRRSASGVCAFAIYRRGRNAEKGTDVRFRTGRFLYLQFRSERIRFHDARIRRYSRHVPVYGEDGTAKLAFCSADGIWLYDKGDENDENLRGKGEHASPAPFTNGCFSSRDPFV